ncbi:MAG: glycosyltransferase family 2 protein [Odoribacter sp.]
MIPKISVIVPVYKVEQYLSKCIESILAQTFTDFELLLIDDGSPDNSGAICDKFAKKDSRIRVFHKKNEGVSSARNLGLDEANGIWITFVDSDDWIEERYLGDLFAGIKNEGLGLVFQGHAKVNNIGVVLRELNFSSYYITQEYFNLLFTTYNIYTYGAPWSKLYNLKLIHDKSLIFDTRINRGEDLLFMFQYLRFCDWVNVVDGFNYMYNIEVSGSLTKKLNSYESERYTFIQLCNIVKELSSIYHIENGNLNGWFLFVRTLIFFAINSIYNSKYDKRTRIKLLEEIMDREAISYMKLLSADDTYISFKIMRLLLVYKFFNLYDIYRSTFIICRRYIKCKTVS